ncbi:MAG: exopolysaccharide biosynthesis glycosyltransferase EpsD [Roseiflexaceae bacterium]
MLTLSIIIPTYNRCKQLQRVLTGLERQTVPSNQFEVIVVSDGSTDDTNDFLKTASTGLQLKPIFQSNSGVAAARNNGLHNASGQLILFLDDDVVPHPQLVAEHLRIHISQPGDVIVLGPMLTPSDFSLAPWVRWEQAMLVKQYDAMLAEKFQPTARQFYTGNTSLAREHLLKAGGFDEHFRRAEDVELAYRLAQAGLRFIFNAQAIGYHYAERSFRSWMNTPYMYGKNDVIFTRDKQQKWLLPKVYSEFHDRNPLIQWLVRICLDRRSLSTAMSAGLKTTARIGDYLRIERLVQVAYSGLFNLQYYQGITDELGGGRAEFLEQVSQADE